MNSDGTVDGTGTGFNGIANSLAVAGGKRRVRGRKLQFVHNLVRSAAGRLNSDGSEDGASGRESSSAQMRSEGGAQLRPFFISTPNGIRTRVVGLKSRCPRPLDDRGACAGHGTRPRCGIERLFTAAVL